MRSTVIHCFLTGLLAMHAAPARSAAGPLAAAGVQVLGKARSPATSGLDWAAIQDRTAQFHERYDRERVVAAPALFPSDDHAVFARLRERVGRPPRWYQRLALPGVSGKAAADEAADELERFVRQTDVELARLKVWLDAAEHDPELRPPQKALLAGERGLAETRAKTACALALESAKAFRLQAGGFVPRLRVLGRQLVGRDGPTLLADLDATLRGWRALRDVSVLGAELTYVEGAQGAGRLPSSAMVPSYLSGPGIGLALEDAAAGSEIELTDEIKAKAQQLASARAAYAFVKNELRLDWYFGSLKSSTETLREGRGNDVDLASLLIALLRAQGTPARYVQGTIELPVSRVAELMSLLTAAEVEALHDSSGFALDTHRRELVMKALEAAGIPYEANVSGGRLESVKILHTWVEAYLDYGNYRGAGARTSRSAWVPIDPALTGTAKYAATPATFDLLQGMGTDAAHLAAEYLHDGTPGQSPLAYVRARAQAWLDGAGPAGTTYEQARRSVAQHEEALPFIPGSLPFAVPAVHAEYPLLPDSARHRVRIRVANAAGATVLDVTAPMHAFVGKRAVLAFEPATAEDALAVALAGGIYRVAAAAVSVTPVVRVAGAAVGQATGSLGLGEHAQWTIDLLMPSGATRTIVNDVVAGNLVAIGLGAPMNRYSETADGAAGADGEAARVLYRAAVEYANSWTAGEEELADVLGVVPLRPTANLVFVENQLSVDEALGVRRRLIWKGLQVDADHRSMTPLELVSGRGKELLRLSGLEGSFQEARVLRATTGEDSVSAVTVIQEASRQGVPVLAITPANAVTTLPQLHATPAVYREIEDHLACGREVTVPSVELTLRDWTGTGFIARDPATDEAGYYLSGVISGGQTIVSPGAWLDRSLVDILKAPTRQKPEQDTRLAARIMKASAPVQRGVVGGEHQVAVYVTTANGRPVYRAPVTFRVLAPSKGTLSSESQAGEQTVRVATDQSGLAAVTLTSDTVIAHAAIVEPGTPNDVLVGYNEVMATVDAGSVSVALPTPFVVLGDHDVPREMRLPDSLDSATAGIQMGQDLWAFLVDRHGNAVPNTPVTWSTSPVAGVYLDYAAMPDRAPRVLDPSDPAQYSSLALYTGTDGGVESAFIPFRISEQARIVDLVATSGSVSGRYQIVVRNPMSESEKYVFFLKRPHLWTEDGVFLGDYPEPVGGQVLRWTGDPARLWVPLTGAEPDVRRVAVRMQVVNVTNPSRPLTLHTEELEPQQRTFKTAPWRAFDDASTAAFWPRFEVYDGIQANYFTYRVELTDGRTIAPTQRWVTSVYSGTPKIERFRLLPGFVERSCDEFGSVSSEDLAAVFRVTNPAAYAIYARVATQPAVPGEELVVIPPADVLARHPADGELIRIEPHASLRLRLATIPGTHGGNVKLQISVPDPKVGAEAVKELVYAYATIHISPPGAGLLDGNPLVAQVTLPVRNFSGTATPTGGRVSMDVEDPPILTPAALDFRVKGDGRVEVFAGDVRVAGALVSADEEGNLTADLQPLSETTAILSQTPTAGLRALVPPQPPNVDEVTVRFTPTLGEVQSSSVPFTTVYKDMGAVPIGHTFVRDVDVVDGHLVKQAQDLAVPGRGVGLNFQRSYTSRSLEDTSLGVGWTHNYNSYVVRDLSAGRIRYAVIGGEGTGQMFDCSAYVAGETPCKNQHGFHGRLEPMEGQIAYTAPNGVRYRYGRMVVDASGPRWLLTQIVDPRGNTTTLVYGEGDVDGALVRVYEPGNRRALLLSYDWPAGAWRPRLSKVELVASSGASPTLMDELAPIDDPGVCIAYDHDATGNLTAVKRYDGACNEETTSLREEHYTYVDSPLPVLRNNLAAYTDPNGNTTTYAYYTDSDHFEGEGQFLLMGDKAERVKSVTEPSPGGTTTFSYVLAERSAAVVGTPRLLYRTIVSGPRPDAPPTTYFVDPYGSVNRVERPLTQSAVAVASSAWDPVHIVPIEQMDPRGRRTVLDYDERGNLTSRVIYTSPLSDPSGQPQTTALVDGAGALVAAVHEKWSYDPAWSAETCHIDPEGRLTTTSYEDGLPVQRRAYAKPIPTATAASSASCSELAATAESTALDHVAHLYYCGVNQECGGAYVKGDLYRVVEGARVTTVTAYDGFGFARTKATSVAAGSSLVSTTLYDPRGRLASESDTLGHSTTRRFDGLDRPIEIERTNTRGGSPGELRTLSYAPGGQPLAERLGTKVSPGLVSNHIWALNGLNRPETATVYGVAFAAITTTMHYDESGNEILQVDGRGIGRATTYDYGDRPRVVRLSIADRGVFVGQGGDVAGFEQGERVIATSDFDAAGNKVSETDAHGHRTVYTLDPLYRVVRTTRSGVRNDVAQRREYATSTTYDLVGNKIRETDADGNATAWTYDHANRVLSETDAAGRFKRNSYDELGQLTLEETGHASGAGTVTTRFSRSYKGYDGLGRPLGTSEQLSTLGPPDGTPSVVGSSGHYETSIAYDDVTHAVVTRDRRGYVTVQYLDDLDRVYKTVADVATSPLLTRQADSRVGQALELTTQYEYDAGGDRSVVIDAEGRRAEEVRDALHRVVRRNLPMGDSESFWYDPDGRVIRQIDARGFQSWRSYDALGRPTVDRIEDSVSTGEAELRVSTRAYVDDPDDTRVVEIDARSYTSTAHLDALHRTYRTERGDSVVETWFDATSTRRQRDPKGYVVETDHDPVGRPAAQRDLDLGGQTVYQQHTTYDDDAGTETAYDRRGIPTLTVRDGLGRVERVSRGRTGSGADSSLFRTEATVFDGGGNAVVLVDPNGHITERVLDGAGRKVIETRAVGTTVAASTTYKYDRVGNPVEFKGPRATGRSFDVRRSYDDRNRPVRSEDALGNVTTTVFDGAGNKVCEKRPLGGDPLGQDGARGRTSVELQALVCKGDHLTRWTYDEASKLLSVTDAVGGLTSFVYDESRNLIGKQDANGSLTTYAYDHLDRRTDEWQHLDAHTRVTSRTEILARLSEGPADPANGTGALHWHYEPDANGNPSVVTDPRGLRTTRVFGVLNRPEHVTYDRPLQVTYPLLRAVTYAYDGNGNVELVTEEKETANGTVQEVTDPTYDTLDRVDNERRYDGKLVQYEYDPKGNRKKVTDPDLVSTTYDYDALDRLVTATTPEGTTTYRYWPDGLEQGKSLPNGLEEGRCYDAAGQLAQIITARGAVGADCQTSAVVVSRFGYQYDADGNRSVQTEQRTSPSEAAPRAAEETRYGYDALDRLRGVRYDDGQTVLYRLDPVGNRTGERELTAQPASVDLAGFDSADASSLARDVTATFNRVDWLVSQVDAKDAVRNTTFGWDLAGNLVSRQKGGKARELLWDARNVLLAVREDGVAVGSYDYDADGSRVKRRTATEQVEYVLDEQYVLQEARGDLAGHPAYRRYHYAEGPLSVTDAAGARFIGTDALGSTTDLTTTSGAVAAAHQYDAWGQYRNGTAPSAGDAKLGYTGHQFDPETGLVYARARYYDPEIGIFISRDEYEGEKEEAPHLHRYAYANCNPLTYVDPDGMVGYDIADEWEKKQRDAAWTAEQGFQGAEQDGARFANWAARKLGDNWFSRSVGAVGVVAVQSLIQVTGSIGAIVGDPTGLVRMPMRLGTGTAQGVEDIRNGKYLEGGLKIVAEGTQAVDLAVGGFASVRSMPGVRNAIVSEMEGTATRRAMVEEVAAREQLAREQIVEEVKSARATESTARAPARQAIENVERVTRLTEKNWEDLQAAKAIGESRTPAGLARLAERAANEPGFMVGMARENTVSGFHGASGTRIMGIIDEGGFIPRNGKVFLGDAPESTFMHGADTLRGEAYSARVDLSVPEGATVERMSTQGVPRTTVVHSQSLVPAEVTELHIRTRSTEGGFTHRVVRGKKAIRRYLTRED